MRTNLTQDRNLSFFIDTGAKHSLVSSLIAQVESSPGNKPRVIGGVGGKTHALGIAHITVYINGASFTFKVDVVPPHVAQHQDVLLGFGIMDEYDAKLDFGTNQLILTIPIF